MRFDAFVILRRRRRLALQSLVILFAVTGFVVISEGKPTRFQMLLPWPPVPRRRWVPRHGSPDRSIRRPGGAQDRRCLCQYPKSHQCTCEPLAHDVFLRRAFNLNSAAKGFGDPPSECQTQSYAAV